MYMLYYRCLMCVHKPNIHNMRLPPTRGIESYANCSEYKYEKIAINALDT